MQIFIFRLVLVSLKFVLIFALFFENIWGWVGFDSDD